MGMCVHFAAVHTPADFGVFFRMRQAQRHKGARVSTVAAPAVHPSAQWPAGLVMLNPGVRSHFACVPPQGPCIQPGPGRRPTAFPTLLPKSLLQQSYTMILSNSASGVERTTPGDFEVTKTHGTGDGDREGAPAEEHVDMRDHVLLMRIFGKLRGRLRPAGV